MSNNIDSTKYVHKWKTVKHEIKIVFRYVNEYDNDTDRDRAVIRETSPPHNTHMLMPRCHCRSHLDNSHKCLRSTPLWTRNRCHRSSSCSRCFRLWPNICLMNTPQIKCQHLWPWLKRCQHLAPKIEQAQLNFRTISSDLVGTTDSCLLPYLRH